MAKCKGHKYYVKHLIDFFKPLKLCRDFTTYFKITAYDTLLILMSLVTFSKNRLELLCRSRIAIRDAIFQKKTLVTHFD